MSDWATVANNLVIAGVPAISAIAANRLAARDAARRDRREYRRRVASERREVYRSYVETVQTVMERLYRLTRDDVASGTAYSESEVAELRSEEAELNKALSKAILIAPDAIMAHMNELRYLVAQFLDKLKYPPPDQSFEGRMDARNEFLVRARELWQQTMEAIGADLRELDVE